MDKQQARQFLGMKLQARINEAKCKALIDDKLLSNLFSQDIQQMHYESVHKKLEMAYILKKLSVAHNKYLCNALEQYSKAIKSNKQLLNTVNAQINGLIDKEKDLLELREETLLGVKETMDIEFNSILSDQQTEEDTILTESLPSVPTAPPEPKKTLTFGNVIIKTVDEIENEKAIQDCEETSSPPESEEQEISVTSPLF